MEQPNTAYLLAASGIFLMVEGRQARRREERRGEVKGEREWIYPGSECVSTAGVKVRERERESKR